MSTISLSLTACGGGGSSNTGGGSDNVSYAFSSIYTFAGPPDGFAPTGGLVQDAAGNLYGTTTGGGDFNHGTVFKVDASGKETLLYSFAGGRDGTTPSSALVRDSSGNLYGTASGGAHNAGTIFKIDPNGTFSLLYTFAGGADGGNNPGFLTSDSPLLLDSAGNLYGATFTGGQVKCKPFGVLAGCGVVFRVDPSGVESVLYSFTGGNDGGNPSAGLIRDSAGNFYGTSGGGAAGGGVVFKLDSLGQLTILYSFTGGMDGGVPSGRLLRDSAGNFYGTTVGGGAAGNGTVFKITPSGKRTVLHSFAGSPDGAVPEAGLVMDSAGNLYGTTVIAGTGLVGMVFRIDSAGNETVLHNFAGLDGSNPSSALMIDKSGHLYGTTTSGGPGPGYGNVFKLTRGQ